MTDARRLELGELRIDALDGGSMAFSVERPGRRIELELAVRPLLVRAASWSCIIDPGFGPADPERRQRFALRDPVPLEQQCRALGLEHGPDHVLLTHLHFDHAAAALRNHGTAQAPDERLRFPSAQHHLHPREWEAALKDGRGGQLAARLGKALTQQGTASGSARPQALPDQGEFLPGLHVELAPGHTEGLLAIWMRGSMGTALYAADLVPTQRFLEERLDRLADQDPQLALQTRMSLLGRCAREGAWLCFYHDLERPWGQLVRAGVAWRLEA